MLPCKRGYDDLAKFLNENKRTCSGGEEETYWSSGVEEKTNWIGGSLLPHSYVWSNMTRSVVSITLSNGHKLLFACSGIAIECQSNFTKFLTSSSLVRALDGITNGREIMKITVHHEGNVARGFLEEYDLDHAMAVIKVKSILGVHCVPLKHEVLPYNRNECVALGCEVNGTVTSTCGKFTGSCGSEDSVSPMFSDCRLSEVMLGGALFGFDGTFLGMNLFSVMERTIFLPRSIIVDRLNHLQPSLQKRIFLALVKPVWYQQRHTGVELSSRPKCSMKANTYGKPFGDEHPSGVWGELSNDVSSKILGNVVALASFNGGTKFFACTGFFIKYVDKCPAILTSASLVRNPDGGNNIVEGLRIEVLLPDKKLCEGKLEHYSLYYNVALVSVENYNVDCPADLEHRWLDFSVKVLAVGRCFELGVLMAEDGVHADLSGDLDCENLGYTTCRITKVGIGGPLVDVNGKFLGMNFYGTKRGTPFLYCDDLCGILKYFRTKETKYWRIGRQKSHVIRDDDGPRNLWILPDSSDTDEDEPDSSDDDEDGHAD
ncbi:unnamed protein product [Urochloa decumbens]|uniref:Uncharacterized protein n=1 Tax=Urochloa decumbens TaxID=240449 RepID=A0ABC9C1F5_9POAL